MTALPAAGGISPTAHDKSLDLGEDERWLCVHTAPHKEFFAAANLDYQGFRCFVPKCIKTVRHARTQRSALAAFFPRYIFTAVDLTVQPWRSILGTFGVHGLIMRGDRPQAVPQGVVERLIGMTNDMGTLDFRDEVQIGQEVRLLSGPFADLVGRLARVSGNGRVAILLEIMGGEREVIVERTALQPIN